MTIVSQLDAKIYKTLIDHLNTMGGYDVIEPDDTFEPDAAEPFIIVQDVRFEPDEHGIGATDAEQNRGMFTLSVITPLSWTYTQQLGLCGVVRDHFPKTLRLYGNGIKLQVLKSPYISENNRRDVAHNRREVLINWRVMG